MKMNPFHSMTISASPNSSATSSPPVDKSSQIASLRKEMAGVQKQITEETQSDHDAKTKAQNIQMLQAELQMIQIQIQQLQTAQQQKTQSSQSQQAAQGQTPAEASKMPQKSWYRESLIAYA
jgi:predicted RNase H-like nuclease (RuvC/YqgF family)